MAVCSPWVYGIVVNWNRSEDTLDCLRSLRRDLPSISLIVVDNASTDGSVESVGREFPEAEIIQMGENVGYVRAMNTGIRRALAAGAEYLLLINNDAVVRRGALPTMLSYLESNPSVGIVGPKILYHGTNIIWYGGGRYSATWGYSTHPGMDSPDSGDCTDTPTDFVTGCIMLVRAEVFDRIGLLDESFWMYVEDLDLCLRARDAGLEVVYLPSAVGEHKVSASVGVVGTNIMSPLRSRCYARNMMLLVLRRGTWRAYTSFIGQLAIRLPYYTVLIAVEGVRGSLRAYLRGMAQGLVEWVRE